jgi:hypothetical protein
MVDVVENLEELSSLTWRKSIGQLRWGEGANSIPRRASFCVKVKVIGVRPSSTATRATLVTPFGLCDATCDFFPGAKQQHGPTNRDHISHSEDSQLDILTVDFGPVGTLQIGQDQLFMVLLDFQVEPADAFVVQLDGVAFLTADRDRSGQIGEHAAAVRAIQNTQRDATHENRSMKEDYERMRLATPRRSANIVPQFSGSRSDSVIDGFGLPRLAAQADCSPEVMILEIHDGIGNATAKFHRIGPL